MDDGRLPGNALVLLGVVVVGLSGVAFVAADNPAGAAAIQLLLPLVIGVGVAAYGWYVREELGVDTRRVVLTWTGVGVATFFAVGAWFGMTSRALETSFLLAVFSSLATGAAFGATVGVYAARLRRANAALQRETDRLEEFASVVSHDLRTPLAVATGRVDLARRTGDDEHLAEAADALDRMDDLLDELLALAREGEPAGTEPVELGRLARRCWADVRTDGTDLEVDDDVTVVADPGLLRQLLANLLENAVEQGATAVTVGALSGGFYVEDDGPGIPAGERDRVFETGYSGDEEGSGIGLGVVSRVADAHGWSVAVTEGAAGGARFEVTGTGAEG